MKKIYVLGLGPGAYEDLTIKADGILREADVVVGYTVYVDLVRKYYPDKKFISTTMKKEIERCRIAFAEAVKGKSVAMVCSGDSGVYGMAGLMYEVGVRYPDVELEILFRQNYSWQGRFRRPGDPGVTTFHSVLELLILLETALEQ